MQPVHLIRYEEGEEHVMAAQQPWNITFFHASLLYFVQDLPFLIHLKLVEIVNNKEASSRANNKIEDQQNAIIIRKRLGWTKSHLISNLALTSLT